MVQRSRVKPFDSNAVIRVCRAGSVNSVGPNKRKRAQCNVRGKSTSETLKGLGKLSRTRDRLSAFFLFLASDELLPKDATRNSDGIDLTRSIPLRGGEARGKAEGPEVYSFVRETCRNYDGHRSSRRARFVLNSGGAEALIRRIDRVS